MQYQERFKEAELRMMRLDELEAEVKTPRSAILDGMPKGPRSDCDRIGTAIGRLEALRERAETLSEEVRQEIASSL